jgi:hypothetical protein
LIAIHVRDRDTTAEIVSALLVAAGVAPSSADPAERQSWLNLAYDLGGKLDRLPAPKNRVTRLPDQTAGLDYSDLVVLLALVNDTRDRLAQILDHITGDDSDTERINAAWTALQDAATPLSNLVSELYANA